MSVKQENGISFKTPENGIKNVDISNTEVTNNESNQKKKFTCAQKVTLVMLALADFTSFCSMSIMAPFYPAEASKKGMSETTAGLVFSFYAFIVFISSPVLGKIMPKIGVKFIFTVGLVVSGICNVIFGTLHYVNDYNTFTLLSFIIRGAEALGASAYSNAGYVLIINIFPNHGGIVRGLLETFVGLGLSTGPAIGGLLFAVGGFGLPFYVIGIFILLIAVLNAYLLPNCEKTSMEDKKGSLQSFLKLPSILVTCFITMVVSITWSFLDPTLEPHLRKFQLTPGNIGLIFLLLSAMYGIFSPVWGWLTDKLTSYWWIMSVGLLFTSFSLLFLGPSPCITFMEDSIWLNIVALSALGICVAMSLMPTYQAILDGALEGGYGDNICTHSLVTSLWSCSYSLGEVIGPVMGGAILEHWNFPVTSTAMALLNFLVSIVSILYFLSRKKNNVKCETNANEKTSGKERFKSNSEFNIYTLPQKRVSIESGIVRSCECHF